MEMNTLQEYLLITETHSYLVAISSVIAFALFWRILNRKPKRRESDRRASEYGTR
jgi:membrane protein implicated in regulation of membrane protease activity